MAKRKCDFECEYLDESGDCDEIGGDCIGSMCEYWRSCQNCIGSEECENVKV